MKPVIVYAVLFKLSFKIKEEFHIPGFSYGGKGDGTNWSSERGSGPEPDGGSTGNSGHHSGGVTQIATDKQYAAIRNDKTIRARLSDMLKAARRINPAMKMAVIR